MSLTRDQVWGTSGVWESYSEGRESGRIGLDATPPDRLNRSQADAWLAGHAEGTAQRRLILAASDDAAE